MKIVGFCGSPRRNGNTEELMKHVLQGAAEVGAQTKLISLNELQIRGCQACGFCRSKDGCAVKDDMQKLYQEINEADAVVIGSPIYMWNLNAQTKAFIDRLYCYMNNDYTSKLNKPALLVITQGQKSPDTFKPSLDTASGVLTFLGLKIQEVVVEGFCYAPDDLSKRAEVVDRAKKAGKSLAGLEKSWD